MASRALNIGHTPQRIGKIKATIKKIKAELPGDVLSLHLIKGQTPQKAYEQYPYGEQLKADATRAEIRRRVSIAMYDSDKKNLSSEDKQGVIDRQVHRYYVVKVGNNELHSHIEAPHGISPSDEVKAWCNSKKVVAYEKGTAVIASKASNHMVFSRPRLFADVNSLSGEEESSLRSEGAVYIQEDNLNAVKAQRDATAKILKETENLDKDGKAINPHLAIYLHGKVDTRGHDFEIGARHRKDKGPIDPRLAFWVADKIKEKVKQKGLQNSNGKEPTINVVTYSGFYSGSPALTRMRYGDGVLDFQGFGEMLQCLQLEVSSYLRNKKTQQISDILNELMLDFSEEFKTPLELTKLQDYKGKFEEKMALEKIDLFNVKNIGFDNDIAEDTIALSGSLREELEVEGGDRVIIKGQEFRVITMKKEHLKNGKSIMLNPKHRELVKTSISIEKAVSS